MEDTRGKAGHKVEKDGFPARVAGICFGGGQGYNEVHAFYGDDTPARIARSVDVVSPAQGRQTFARLICR